MPTIRDVVQALSARSGVEAVVVLGRDGLPIDAQTSDDMDTEGVAALVPGMVTACEQLAKAAQRGHFTTSVVEFSSGMAVVSSLTEETLLAIVFAPDTNIGDLLHELRQHRRAIAALL
jgi:predicted regulator of Ras-like GTPase activity (Roadblock/LC7/MglB family)